MHSPPLHNHIPRPNRSRLARLHRQNQLPSNHKDEIQTNGTMQRTAGAGRRVNIPDGSGAAGEHERRRRGEVRGVGGDVNVVSEGERGGVRHVGEAEVGAAEVLDDGEGGGEGVVEGGDAGGGVGGGDDAVGVGEGVGGGGGHCGREKMETGRVSNSVSLYCGRLLNSGRLILTSQRCAWVIEYNFRIILG